MPTNTGSWPVLIDSGLAEFAHTAASELRRLSAQFVEKRRKLIRGFHRTPAVIVPQPETGHSSISQMALELKRLELQLLQASYKRSLLDFSDKRLPGNGNLQALTALVCRPLPEIAQFVGS